MELCEDLALASYNSCVSSNILCVLTNKHRKNMLRKEIFDQVPQAEVDMKLSLGRKKEINIFENLANNTSLLCH